jgi:ABC-type nitrate/sulfonate/bicarbonate transport system substrate-binding protein
VVDPRLPPWMQRLLRAGSLLLAGLLPPGLAIAQDLRLAVSQGPVSLPIYVAQSEGYFRHEGVAVRLQDCSSGRDCMQRLIDGQADLATAAELVVTLESARISDAAIYATISRSAHHIKLVARRADGLQAPADLHGKRIGTVEGTSAQYFLDRWLVFHGIDPGSVHVAAMPPGRLVQALQQRLIDAVAIWEPVASQAVETLGGEALVLPSSRVYTQHFCLVGRRSGMSGRHAALLGALRALERAQRFIAGQPAQAAALLQARLKRPGGSTGLAEHDFSLALDQSLIATMEGQARWAGLQGRLPPWGPASGNLLRFVEPSFLRQAVPGAVGLAP